MKERVDQGNQWGRRLYFEDREFEQAADEARSCAGSASFEPSRGVDIDLVLLKRFRLEPVFDDLPEHTLGRTEFGSDGSMKVTIQRQLEQRSGIDVVARRRLRSTLAHECGHVALHRTLWMPDFATATGSMFAAARRPGTGILCRREDIERGQASESAYNGQWWEYQANRFMAAVLLPRDLLKLRALEQVKKQRKLMEISDLFAGPMRDDALRAFADYFDVNVAMVDIRVRQLGWSSSIRQQSTLAFGES